MNVQADSAVVSMRHGLGDACKMDASAERQGVASVRGLEQLVVSFTRPFQLMTSVIIRELT